MADLSKLRFNGTDYNVKDASAPKRKFDNTYAKTGNLPITSDDTTQTAIGKLEKALDDKINTSAKGTASGVAELDANGKVPSSQLPSYVDDVLEYSAKSSFPATGETGKIYVDTSNNKTYRWSGSAYVEISESLALGETSSTAYRGDRGKAAYDHSQITNGNPHGTTGANTNLTGYSKGSSKDAVAATDTVNAAIAKHENRINANQSNILYALQTGVKNLFDLKNADITAGVTNISSSKTDTSLTVTTTGEKKWSHVSIPMELEAGTYHVLTTISGRTADSSAITRFIVASGAGGTPELGGVTFTNNGTIDFQFTTTGGTVYLIPYPNYSSTGYNATFTASDIMVCTKAAWDQEPNVYRPYALPNSDLTVLEAEDRAGLVDVVDSRAKNFIKCFDTYSITEVTQTSSNGVVSATWTAIGSSNVYCRINEDLTLQPGTYIITGMQESNVAYYLHLEANGSTVVNVETTAAAEFTVTNASAVYRLFIGVKANSAAQTSPKTIKPMLCTKAAFGVSPKFVPFKYPYAPVLFKQVKHTFTTSDWERISELDFVVPNGYAAQITAGTQWRVGKATGVRITNSTTTFDNSHIIAQTDDSNGQLNISATGMAYAENSNVTLYVYAKHTVTAASDNFVNLCVIFSPTTL